MTRSSRLGRRGASLIEVVVVMASVTVILSLCGTFLHLLLRLDQAGRASLNQSAAVARLARQFRQDVRDATEARPVKAKDETAAESCELALPGGVTVSYANEAKRVLRTESAGGKVRRREGYALTTIGPASFAAGDGLARLDLPRRPALDGQKPEGPGLRIEAAVGRHAGLARAASAKKGGRE